MKEGVDRDGVLVSLRLFSASVISVRLMGPIGGGRSVDLRFRRAWSSLLGQTCGRRAVLAWGDVGGGGGGGAQVGGRVSGGHDLLDLIDNVDEVGGMKRRRGRNG